MSIFRLTHLAGMALLAVVVGAGTAKATKADPIGAQSFGELGSPTADGSPTGNINTATTFTVDELTSAGNREGIFVGMPRQTISAFTFNLTSPTSLVFGNGVFGHFASSSISKATSVPGIVGFDVIGGWSPGSFFHGVGPGPFLSLFTLSFTQTPNTTGPISLSATFSTTATVIPEPPSIVLVLTGLAVGVGIYGLRRGRRYLVTA